jgi:hypothetical protein
MKEYYTYAYLREDGTPYYVGKGTGNRAYNKHKRRGNNVVPVPTDKNRILILKRFYDEDLAYRHEEYLIFHYGKEKDGGILINLCEGGRTRAIYTEEERKERRKIAIKKYYENNKEKCKKHYENNKEKCNAASKKHYENNKEKCNAAFKKYYENNKEKCNAASKKWADENRESRRLAERKRYAKNPEKYREKSRRNYLRKKNK